MLKNYIKIAFKVFLRRKFFTFISLFAISFTLVVLMTFTALLDHIFGAQPPEKKHDRTLATYRLVLVGDDSIASGQVGYKLFDSYMRNISGVERMSLLTQDDIDSYHKGEKIQSTLKHTDGEFWKIFNFTFLEGEPFTDDDEKQANFVAVINKRTRDKFFINEPAVGKTIEADGQRFRVVGIVEDVSIARDLPFGDIWVPISTMKNNSYREQIRGEFKAIFLARNKSDIPKIKDEFQTRLKKVEVPEPKQFKVMFSAAETAFENISRQAFRNLIFNDRYDYRSHPKLLLTVIILLMVLFMIIPTINLININTSRIMERSSEIGVRKAFGASTRTLIGQFIIENIILTIVGGVIGLLLSQIVLHFISESGVIPYAIFHLNYRVFVYGFAVTIFFGFISGVLPAWRMSRLHPVNALKGAAQ